MMMIVMTASVFVRFLSSSAQRRNQTVMTNVNVNVNVTAFMYHAGLITQL